MPVRASDQFFTSTARAEEEVDRVEMLVTLANLAEPPESVPINMLIPIGGTPFAEAPPIAPIEFVRIVALPAS